MKIQTKKYFGIENIDFDSRKMTLGSLQLYNTLAEVNALFDKAAKDVAAGKPDEDLKAIDSVTGEWCDRKGYVYRTIYDMISKAQKMPHGYHELKVDADASTDYEFNGMYNLAVHCTPVYVNSAVDVPYLETIDVTMVPAPTEDHPGAFKLPDVWKPYAHVSVSARWITDCGNGIILDEMIVDDLSIIRINVDGLHVDIDCS